MNKDVPVFVAVGRRKTSTARVRVASGSGKILVNDKPVEEYCFTEALAKTATRPVSVAGLEGSLDIEVRVNGGGCNSQAGAISHGVARAIEKYNPELRTVLKKAGLLTRDGRSKERKKSGQPGARKRFQFSKR